MATQFGIHMGNSSVCLSIQKDEKIDIVASKFGDRTSLAVVAIANDNEFLIGLPAKQGRVRNGPLTIINNFQFLNDTMTKEEFDDSAANSCLCKIKSKPITYELTKDDISITMTPYDVAVKLLQNCFENASHAAKLDDDLEAIISVPLNYSKKARQEIAKAADESGFNVLQMLSDPAAALLAYEIGYDVQEKSNVLIYRLGGLTTDIYLFRVINGMYESIGNYSMSNLGGNNLTKVLCDYMATEFYNKYKLDPRESHRTMAKLWQYAENCKHILSTMPTSHAFIESLMDGVDWSQNISRARFENIIASQLPLFVRPVEKLITKHNDIKIDKIIFCGGSMKIPKIQSAISALFPNAQILNSIPPDEVIAIGCAKQASFVNEAWDPEGEHIDMDLSILKNDIYVESEENKIEKTSIFVNESIVPISTTFKTKSNENGKIALNIIQGNNTEKIEYICPLANNEFDIRAKLNQGNAEKSAAISIIFPTEKLIN